MGVRWGVVEMAVWLIASIFALNALMLGTSVLLVSHGRHRARREIRQLEALWRLDPSPAARLRNRRRVALTVAAALAWAGVAIAMPGTGRVVTSAFGVVIPVILGEGTASRDRADGTRSNATATGSSADLAERSSGISPASTDPDAPRSAPGSANEGAVPAFVSARPRSPSVIRILWAVVPDATGYDVERSTDGTTDWVTIATTGDEVNAYTDAGLTPDRTYFYRVLVMLEDGTASPSDVVSATTPVDAPDPTVVSVASTSHTSVDLVWSDVADETGYRIERSADGETGWAAIGTTGQDVTTYTDAGLDPGTTSSYRVIAINDGGASAPSNVVTVTTTEDSDDIDQVVDLAEASQGDEPSTSPEPAVTEE
jgi:hypothetical protein